MQTTYLGIVEKMRQAENENYSNLCVDEKLLAAFVLNRNDVLQETGFTLPEAIRRIGISKVAAVPLLADLLMREKQLNSKRFSYLIKAISEDKGGGYSVIFYDSGIKYGRCEFPLQGEHVQYPNEAYAYSQAVNTALNWVEDMQQQHG